MAATTFKCVGLCLAIVLACAATAAATCSGNAECRRSGDAAAYCKASGSCQCSNDVFWKPIPSQGCVLQFCRNDADCRRSGDELAYCNPLYLGGNGRCHCTKGFKAGTSDCVRDEAVATTTTEEDYSWEDLVLAAQARASAVQAVESTPFKTCGNGEVDVKSIELSKIVPGGVASFTASGDLSKAATGGTFKITITLFGIPVMNMSGNLCNSKYFHVKCPAEPGMISASGSFKVLSIAPKGTYGVKITASDTKGDLLFCVTMKANVSENPRPDTSAAPATWADLENLFQPIPLDFVTHSA